MLMMSDACATRWNKRQMQQKADDKGIQSVRTRTTRVPVLTAGVHASSRNLTASTLLSTTVDSSRVPTTSRRAAMLWVALQGEADDRINVGSENVVDIVMMMVSAVKCTIERE